MITAGEKEALVVYSLGNFISNQRKRYTDGGILFSMSLEKKEKTFVSGYSYLPVWVYKPQRADGGDHFVLTPSNREKSWYDQIGMPDSDFQKLKLFNDDTTGHLKDIKITGDQ